MAAANVGKQINDLIETENWTQARSLIKKALAEEPKSHWLLTQLGETYYEEMKYRRALRYLLQARDIVPDCPLTLWYLAGTVDALGYHAGAMRIYTWILASKKRSHDDPCWESERWTEALKTDCVFAIGICFRNMENKVKAIDCFRQYIRLLSIGMPGSYTLEEAMRQITLLQPTNKHAREVELQRATNEVRRKTGTTASRLPQLDREELERLQGKRLSPKPVSASLEQSASFGRRKT